MGNQHLLLMNRNYANVAVACRTIRALPLRVQQALKVVLGACTYILIIGSRLKMKRPCRLEDQCHQKSLFALVARYHQNSLMILPQINRLDITKIFQDCCIDFAGRSFTVDIYRRVLDRHPAGSLQHTRYCTSLLQRNGRSLIYARKAVRVAGRTRRALAMRML